MKKNLSILSALLGLGLTAAAQTANVQVIHNSATPAAATVDIYYFTGTAWGPTPAISDLAYRTATPYVQLPSGIPNARVAVAPGSSTGIGDTLVSFALPSLTEDADYVAMAAGLVGNATTPFNLFLSGGQQSTGAAQVAVKIFHGATDAPAVGIFGVADAINPLVPGLSYGNFTPAYTDLDSGATDVILTLSPDYNTMVGGFSANTGAFAGSGAVIFASGFLSPAGGQPGFGLFAAFPDGTVAEFDPADFARAQVIHNAADPALAEVDVYVSVPLLGIDIPFLQSFEYKNATPYIFLPVLPIPLAVKFTAPGGSPASPVATIPLTLATNTTYSLIANGVASTAGGSFANAVTVNNTAINFNVKIINDAKVRSVTSGNVSVYAVHHGVDAPAVDLLLNNAGALTPLVTNVSYNGAALIDAPGADLRLDVAPTGAAAIKAYTAPLSAFGNQSLVVLASGFLTPADENVANLQAFGLFAVPATGGEFIPLPEINIAGILNGSVESLELDVFPNPTMDVVNVKIPATLNTDATVIVVDMNGRVLKSTNLMNQNANSGVYSMNVDELAAGTYSIIITDNKSTFSSRLIKR